LDVAKKNIASKTDNKSQKPTYYNSTAGPFLFVVPLQKIWSWGLP